MSLRRNPFDLCFYSSGQLSQVFVKVRGKLFSVIFYTVFKMNCQLPEPCIVLLQFLFFLFMYRNIFCNRKYNFLFGQVNGGPLQPKGVPAFSAVAVLKIEQGLVV